MTALVMDALPLWAPEIASDGLCLDTALGDVDLVAVELARHGHRVTLTPAELVYLAEQTGPLGGIAPDVVETRDLIGEGLGLPGKTVAALFGSLLTGGRT
jgi:hypothetical protein